MRRVVDLSYAINDKLVPWPGDARVFEAKVNASMEKDGYFTRSFWMLEHYGTHLDAPAHFASRRAQRWSKIQRRRDLLWSGGRSGRAKPKRARRNPDYRLNTEKRIEAWEEKHGKIPAGAIVVLRTGWATRWPDVARYRNQDAKAEVMHFPGYSVEAAKYATGAAQSECGLGCDTLSIDPGNSPDFPVHHLVLGADLYQLENLANLSGICRRASGVF